MPRYGGSAHGEGDGGARAPVGMSNAHQLVLTEAAPLAHLRITQMRLGMAKACLARPRLTGMLPAGEGLEPASQHTNGAATITWRLGYGDLEVGSSAAAKSHSGHGAEVVRPTVSVQRACLTAVGWLPWDCDTVGALRFLWVGGSPDSEP